MSEQVNTAALVLSLATTRWPSIDSTTTGRPTVNRALLLYTLIP